MRVLLIEDEDAYRETVGFLLRKEGFDVVEAAGPGADHDPARHRMRLELELGEGADGDGVVAAPVGGALGVDRIETADEADWSRMYDINVLSILRMVQALLFDVQGTATDFHTPVTAAALLPETATKGA